MKSSETSKIGFGLLLIFFSCCLDTKVTAQSDPSRSSGAPFVGFQANDGSRVGIRDASSNQADRARYPYPAVGRVAPGTQSQFGVAGSQTPVRSQLGSQMSRNELTTGNLNHFGRATAAVNAQTAQAVQQQSYRADARLRNFGPTSAASGQRSYQPSIAQRQAPQRTAVRSVASSRTRLNQPVVQQTSSTASRSRSSSANTTTVARVPTRQANTVVARVPQNCVCVPNNAQNASMFRQSTLAANQAPALNANNSGAGGFTYQPYQFQPGLGAPQFGRREGVLAPFVRGSGVYTPLLPIFAMPQGTYLGQGIIGQPTAYVNGQPVRNLLRYIFP